MTWRGREAQEWMRALADDDDRNSEARPSSPPELSPKEQAEVQRLASLIEADVPSSNLRERLLARSTLVSAGTLAAAAAAVFVLGVGLPSDDGSAVPIATAPASLGTIALERGGQRLPVTSDTPLFAGDQIFSSGQAKLHFAEGARVVLSDQAHLGIVKTSTMEGVRLQEGRIDLQIPKQTAGNTWSVTTGSAVITVIGTAFAVWTADDGGAQVTCVTVAEGKVRAQSTAHEKLLGKGDTWSSAPQSMVCEGPREPEKMRNDQPPSSLARGYIPPPSTTKVAASGTKANESSLAAQNELFLQVVQARREGQLGRTRQLGASFLKRYPSSPLASQVRAEVSQASR